MKRCLVWGIGNEYDQYVNLINFEVLKKNIEIIAYISKDIICKSMNNRPVITPYELNKFQYDYIIVCNTVKLEDISNLAMNLGISKEKIISGKKLTMPYFDFNRYLSLIENKITIISDDCWGAQVYNYLGLGFLSPFILCSVSSEDYIKLLENLQYYIQDELKLEREGNREKLLMPRGYLGNDDNKIIINFNHVYTFKKGKEDWNRRKQRINWNNLFIKMTIPNEEIAKRFDKLPYKNKIGFYHCNGQYESVKSICEWDMMQDYNAKYHGSNYASYIRSTVRGGKSRVYDIFKLLTGEKDFLIRK